MIIWFKDEDDNESVGLVVPYILINDEILRQVEISYKEFDNAKEISEEFFNILAKTGIISKVFLSKNREFYYTFMFVLSDGFSFFENEYYWEADPIKYDAYILESYPNDLEIFKIIHRIFEVENGIL